MLRKQSNEVQGRLGGLEAQAKRAMAKKVSPVAAPKPNGSVKANASMGSNISAKKRRGSNASVASTASDLPKPSDNASMMKRRGSIGSNAGFQTLGTSLPMKKDGWRDNARLDDGTDLELDSEEVIILIEEFKKGRFKKQKVDQVKGITSKALK